MNPAPALQPGHVPAPASQPGHVPAPALQPGHVPAPASQPGHVPSAACTGHADPAPGGAPSAQERRQAALDRLSHIFRDAGTGPTTQRLFCVLFDYRAGAAGEMR